MSGVLLTITIFTVIAALDLHFTPGKTDLERKNQQSFGSQLLRIFQYVAIFIIMGAIFPKLVKFAQAVFPPTRIRVIPFREWLINHHHFTWYEAELYDFTNMSGGAFLVVFAVELLIFLILKWIIKNLRFPSHDKTDISS